MMNLVRLSVEVNGANVDTEVEARLLLSDFLRDSLGLTGTHVGCEQGVCGSCTVLINGKPVRSCTTLAVQVDGASVSTVESLSDGGRLDQLQQAFADQHGLQCGFCTPGFLMALQPLVSSSEPVSDGDILEAVSGNLCRCTGYQGILAAIREVTKSARVRNS